MSNLNNNATNLKRKIAAIFAGTMLVIPAAMPASAAVPNTHGQHLTGGQKETLLLARKEKPTPRRVGEWHLEKKGARFGQLTQVEQQKFDQFQNAIYHEGLSPQEAARRIGDAHFTKLKGTKDQYEIRLGGKARATFLINQKDHVVKILQVGGHT